MVLPPLRLNLSEVELGVHNTTHEWGNINHFFTTTTAMARLGSVVNPEPDPISDKFRNRIIYRKDQKN